MKAAIVKDSSSVVIEDIENKKTWRW